MKEIRITRAFLKKPLNSVIVLACIILLIEWVGWSIGYKAKMHIINRAGGELQYILILFLDLFIPELCTLLITLLLINTFHTLRRIDTVKTSLHSIAAYELQFIPILLASFLIFNPFTQTVRFFLERFPNYSFSEYINGYILYTYSWAMYFRYLGPVLLIGYLSITISLIQDYWKQQNAINSFEVQNHKNGLSTSPTFQSKSVLTFLKGRNAQGELDFPVKDAYYFTIEERLYYAELAKGRYLISKTLNELEAELDPSQFFRIKRDYIVNRQAVLSYAHWENGKYIVRLNTPISQDIVIPRTRMQELREWLQRENKELLEVNQPI